MGNQVEKSTVTPEQAAERLGVHRNTVYRWIGDGKLPGTVRKGAGGERDRYLIPVAALEALEERFVRPAV